MIIGSQSTRSACPWTISPGKSTSGTVQIRWVLCMFSLRVDAATLTELSSNVFISFNVFFLILIFMFTNGRYNLFLLLTAD